MNNFINFRAFGIQSVSIYLLMINTKMCLHFFAVSNMFGSRVGYGHRPIAIALLYTSNTSPNKRYVGLITPPFIISILAT